MSDKLDRIRAIVTKHVDNEDYYDDDDFNAYEVSGGNFDDAFSSGVDQGYGDLAREILALLDE